MRMSHHPCNNGCTNCLTTPEAVNAKPPDTDVSGAHVVIGGFEPLLSPNVFGFINNLKKQNPQSINLLTNGRLLVYPQYVDRLASAGLDRVFVKFFGGNAEDHDRHTKVEGSFEQSSKAVRALRGRGVAVNVTFPKEILEATPDAGPKNPLLVLAYALTNTLPVTMPSVGSSRFFEPIQQGNMAVDLFDATPVVGLDHPGQYRYDVIYGNHEEGVGRWWSQVFPTVHILTGPMCNVKCLYCNVHGGDERYQNLYQRDYVLSLLQHAADAGFAKAPGNPTVDFIGGEPTMHPELADFIECARDLNFPNITICTNGVRLAQPGYLDRLIEAGLKGVRYSFHNHRMELARDLADAGSVGDTYVQVAKMLLNRSDVTTYFYRIVLSNTMDDLPAYMKWLDKHNKTGKPLILQLGLPSPRGRMFENTDLFPDLNRAREAVLNAVELGNQLGFDVTCHHAPGCIVPGDPTLAATNNVHARQIDARTNSYNVLNFEGDSRHASLCAECGYKDFCPGVPVYYFDQSATSVEEWVRPFDSLEQH